MFPFKNSEICFSEYFANTGEFVSLRWAMTCFVKKRFSLKQLGNCQCHDLMPTYL